MPVDSTPPPSHGIPERSGGGLYLLGALVLVGAAAGLYVWKKPAPPPATPQATVKTAAVAPEPEAPLYAPPPPPKLDDEDAGTDAGPPPAKTATASSAPGLGPCSSACQGTATAALKSALSGMAGSARGCYQRALRTSEVSGSLTVNVQVGPSGQVCSASISNDSVHSSEITSCVLGRFRGGSFPPPSGGCVSVAIPMNFTAK